MKVLNSIIFKATMVAAVMMLTLTVMVVIYGLVIVTLAVAGVDITPFVPVRCTEYW